MVTIVPHELDSYGIIAYFAFVFKAFIPNLELCRTLESYFQLN